MKEISLEELATKFFMEDEIKALYKYRQRTKDRSPQRRRVDNYIIQRELRYKKKWGRYYKPKHL